MSTALYALACVTVPAVWGVAMYYLFGFLQRRRKDTRRPDDPPPVDYSI